MLGSPYNQNIISKKKKITNTRIIFDEVAEKHHTKIEFFLHVVILNQDVWAWL
jgi:hypothetical protein